MTREALIDAMKREIAKELRITPEEIHAQDSFAELGLDSVSGVYLLDKLEKLSHSELNPLMLWDYPTLEKLAEYITQLKQENT